MQRNHRLVLLLPTTLALGLLAWTGLADASPEVAASAPIAQGAADEQVCSADEAAPLAADDACTLACFNEFVACVNETGDYVGCLEERSACYAAC